MRFSYAGAVQEKMKDIDLKEIICKLKTYLKKKNLVK